MRNTEAKSIRHTVARLVAALILICVAVTVYKLQSNTNADYTVQVVPPTCTDSGYTLYTNEKTGATDVSDVIPPAGHQYGQWVLVREAEGVNPSMDERTCSVCGAKEDRAEYTELGLPRLSLTGDFSNIGKKNEVPLSADFFAEEVSFTAYATAKYQGHSTLVFDKKNYTVKFFEDAQRQQKMKMELSHWNPENKYILKANYQDPSQSRNLVSADIWADMVKSRENVPDTLKNLSNYGAVDGFPIALYQNHNFHGLYTMNLHKDDDLFGMKESKSHAIMIINHAEMDEANFLAKTEFAEDASWEVEFCGTEDQTWARDKLNALIEFVRTADDETFRTEIGAYLDVQSAVDYVIAMYSLGLQEHSAKDLVLITYGPEEPWICSLYDMEEAFDTEGVYPVLEGDAWTSGTGSLLWDRIVNVFFEDICHRYAQLRQNILAPEALNARLKAYVTQIPWELYEADAKVNSTEVFTDAQLEAMTENIVNLIEKTDELFLGKGT